MSEDARDVTIDVAALLASAGGDHGLLEELTTTFDAERPAWIASLRAALAAGDAAAVRRVAHSIAGALGYLRAASVRQRALALETMGSRGPPRRRGPGDRSAGDRPGHAERTPGGGPWRG